MLTFYFLVFICLLQVWAVACGIFDLHCSMWTLSWIMWLDLVPWPGIETGPLCWEHAVLATEPPGTSRNVDLFFSALLISTFGRWVSLLSSENVSLKIFLRLSNSKWVEYFWGQSDFTYSSFITSWHGTGIEILATRIESSAGKVAFGRWISSCVANEANQFKIMQTSPTHWEHSVMEP